MDIHDIKDLIEELQDDPDFQIQEMILRNAKSGDARRLAEIDRQCFPQPYSESMLSHDIQYGDNLTLLTAVIEQEIVGYIEIMIVADECEIQRVAVLPEYRRRYVASMLMDATLHLSESLGIKSHYLEVRAGNEPAIKLYEHFGFQKNGVRKKYYGDEDAVLMLRIGDPQQFDPDKLS